ncbi:hypothetical protein [Microbulbifer sp. HZ11]|uniref:hypothetical protein n=1 Tax=Microbulbifer sp. HZ11 TaxID=1453501 RepID=UPI0005B9ECFD|nr:hypothetical protein [Microbulbifer sp. HZ11]
MINIRMWAPKVVVGLLFCFWVGEIFAQIPPNSRRFQINDYYGPDGSGGYELYRAHGFALQSADNIKTKIFLLPLVEARTHAIEFYDDDGFLYDPADSPKQLARSISIPLALHQKLPSKEHTPAFVSALSDGISVTNYMYPSAKAPNGMSLIYPPAQGLAPQLHQANMERDRLFAEQQKMIEQFDNYAPELVNLLELEISVRIGSEQISVVSYPHSFITMGDTLSVAVENPSMYEQNRIRQGKMDVLVAYKFRDAKTSTISARFDAKRIVNRFLREVQQSSVKKKSSGWQFLGFGSRRSTLKTAFNQSVDSQFKGSTSESTTIEMFDADDSMIEQFEADFFPELSRQSVIENHLEAARIAAASGNEKLRDLHLKYADAVENSNPDLEVDVADAVASLSAGDYAGFLAKGVRWGDHRATGNSSFRRVINEQAAIDKNKAWSQSRTVSVQRSLTMKADRLNTREQWPDMGICGVVSYNYQVPIERWNGWQWVQKVGVMPTCVTENGPARSAGIIPGMIVADFDGELFTSSLEAEDFLRRYKPGDRVTARVVDFPPGRPPQYTDYDIQLSAGKPIKL